MENRKVVIKSMTEETDDDVFEQTIVEIDGKRIGQGSYGSEPEDNTRYRHYGWVENLIKKVAEELGADVEIQNIKRFIILIGKYQQRN